MQPIIGAFPRLHGVDAAIVYFSHAPWKEIRNNVRNRRWTMPVRPWREAMAQFAVLYPDRFTGSKMIPGPRAISSSSRQII